MAEKQQAEEPAPRDDNDVRAMYRHAAFKGVQAGALISPPVLILSQLFRKSKTPFNLNRFLRGNAIGAFAIGTPISVGIMWARTRNMDGIAIGDRAFRLANNATQIQVDDYSIVGGILGSLLTTAVFLRRASLASTIIGGTALGVNGGVLTHLVRNWISAPPEPNRMIVEVKEAIAEKQESKQGKNK